MNPYSVHDVDIEEIHHTQKKDAPSGTAITLASDIITRLDRKESWHCIEPQKGEQSVDSSQSIEITSLREGAVPGTHTVKYESSDDILEIKHTLKSRSALATGAVIAAEFICGKSGVFTMDDLFKE
jgi:4-hydroxy-tetrahydrodipicolinate reductase